LVVTVLFIFWLFLKNSQHLCLESLLVFAQSVLLPCEVSYLCVEVVSGHAVFKESYALLIIGFLFEF